ncbi:MAG: hypothetical protein RLZZ393_549 [Pseudomonadota bacterium]
MPVRRATRSTRAGHRGSTLIEVLVAIMLFSVGVLALLRILAISVQDSGDIEYRAVASAIADERVGRMWVDRTNLAAYSETDTAIPQLPQGTRTVSVNGAVVTVTVTWRPPRALIAHSHQVVATITGN